MLGFYPASFDPYAKTGTSNKRAVTTSASPSSSSTSSAHQSVISASSSKATSASTSTRNVATTVSSATPLPSTWDNPAYPYYPNVSQPDLGTYGGGFVSGYFIGNGVAVLSIPSFVEVGEAVNTFSDTIGLFLRRCNETGMKKIVIDLQENTGGSALLAFDTFKQFFPNLDPFGGSRLRAHPAADVMGDAITSYWNLLTEDDDDYYNLAADEWLSADRINADTNRNFTSWAEFFGPHSHYGDNFTTTVSPQPKFLAQYITKTSFSNDITCPVIFSTWNPRKTFMNISLFMGMVETQLIPPSRTQLLALLFSRMVSARRLAPCSWR